MVSKTLNQFNGKEVVIYEIGDTLQPGNAIKLLSYSYEDDQPKIVEKLQELIDTGKSHQLEELVFGVWQESWELGPTFIDFLVNNRHYFSRLKHVFVGDMTYEDCEISWIIQTNYQAFFQAFAQLQTFGVRGGNGLRFGDFSLPQLKKFTLHSGGTEQETIQDLVRSNSFKNLESLEIWFGTEDYGATVTRDDIQALLNLDMPNLKHLGFMNSDLQNDIVELLANHPVMQQLQTLDISMGILQDEGGKHLLNNDSFSNIEQITLDHHFLSDELTHKIKQKYANRIHISAREDDDGGEWFHVAVGE